MRKRNTSDSKNESYARLCIGDRYKFMKFTPARSENRSASVKRTDAINAPHTGIELHRRQQSEKHNRYTPLCGTGHRPVYVVVGSSSQAVSSQQQQQQQRQRQQSRWAGSGIPRRARVSGTHRHVVHSGNKGEVSRGRSPRPARTFWLTRGGLDQSFRYVHESKILPKILILDIFQC
ncbi:hypothetical protein HZH68_002352 [Vespula germanica]|uniref:Uncharacterized protein n=3 Tax=Vespula TaxID=7451 RepID=A0A834KVS6_VESGE|nr:hypothetical protein HZH68_002352 [Vespula germanica]KAF7434393.1 hypothetical protein H0235_002584 [Vespula pensylvanica]